MRTPLLSLTCIVLAFQAVQAGSSAPAPAAASASPVVETKPVSGKAGATAAKAYAPARKSLFTAAAADHNPFWPIGWVNLENLSASSATAPVIPHSEDFTVTSILLNEPPMAVINGKEMAEGEIAAINLNGQQVMVQLIAVQDGRVILRWQNQNILVSLRRNEELSKTDPEQPAAVLR